MPHRQASLTLAEQVVAAELSYYRQLEQCLITEADVAAWHRKQALVYIEDKDGPTGVSYPFAHHIFERHHGSLHAYMAQQLSVEAWTYWYLQGGIIAPFQ